jgi:O-acetyl-ADP-ribose deacetylase (regulator of RNase III)
MTAVALSSGNIFDSDCEALVSPVDTTGAQGKGLALEFKRRFPIACKAYRIACDYAPRRPGSVWYYADGRPTILFAATKAHWRGNSCLPWIRQCAQGLIRVSHDLKLNSMAVPMLGAGLGMLHANDVRPILIEMAREMYCSRVVIFEPR